MYKRREALGLICKLPFVVLPLSISGVDASSIDKDIDLLKRNLDLLKAKTGQKISQNLKISYIRDKVKFGNSKDSLIKLLSTETVCSHGRCDVLSKLNGIHIHEVSHENIVIADGWVVSSTEYHLNKYLVG